MGRLGSFAGSLISSAKLGPEPWQRLRLPCELGLCRSRALVLGHALPPAGCCSRAPDTAGLPSTAGVRWAPLPGAGPAPAWGSATCTRPGRREGLGRPGSGKLWQVLAPRPAVELGRPRFLGGQ